MVWNGSYNWHDSFYDGTACKQLIPIAASVESLYEAADDEIYLVAQWEDEHGIRRNCGYEIFSKKLMAHAFGGMDGTTYHNTAEAFEHGKRKAISHLRSIFPIRRMTVWYCVMAGQRIIVSAPGFRISRNLHI